MLCAYFDDSGEPTSPHDRTVTIAGCVASVEAWSTLADDWRGLLEGFNLSWFHAVDFEHSRDEFATWDEQQKEEFRKRMLQIIMAHIDRGARHVGCVVPHHYVPREDRARRGTIHGLDPEAAWNLVRDDPWFICIAWCLQESSRLAQDFSPREGIRVVFARKEKLSGKAAEFYNEIVLHFPALWSRVKQTTFDATP